MVRLIALTLLFAYITFVSAQSVSVLNTPAGPITQGVKIPITWDTTAPATQPGTLEAIEKNTQNTSLISDTVDINAKSFDWIVNVNPGTYNLAINDGAGQKFSGAFDVVAPKSVAPPGTAPPPPAGAAPGAPAAPPKGPPKTKEPKTNVPPKDPKVVRRALPSTSQSGQPQPSQSQAAAKSASTKSAYDLLLSLMTVAVAVIMVHSA